ncbi:MAG: hypothetical protein D6725_12995 [Planctomycetota bacterium]|nr:MAG: hypothetical protein D6725_12995 [Planctomycetota bacterium]
MSETDDRIRRLRRRWKPHKERLKDDPFGRDTCIRFHRACSWIDRALHCGSDDVDLALIMLWMGFNALYGQWDIVDKCPKPDVESWKAFLDKILSLDGDGRLPKTLQEHRQTVVSLLGNPYVNKHYWKTPDDLGALKRAKSKGRKALSWYFERNWPTILEETLDRVYLVRCQLAHGAATYGGSRNRKAVQLCVDVLDPLLFAMLNIWIDYGADENWGKLCYPPLDGDA